MPNDLTKFRNKWKGVSGIYKITFLPFRLFTYYGSTNDFSLRFKNHFYNTPKQNKFLGTFLSVFEWYNFSITIVEICSTDKLLERENWYLSRFKPLLNFLTNSSNDPRGSSSLSLLTRSKISATLIGRKESDKTRMKKSLARLGDKNPFFAKGPGKKAIDIAAEFSGLKVYVYDELSFSLVNGVPFRSIRQTANAMPISASTLPNKIDTGIPFKGYYYYSNPQTVAPK